MYHKYFLCVFLLFCTTLLAQEQTITTSEMKQYQYPTGDAEVQGTLMEGSAIVVLDTLTNFYRIKSGYGEGFILKKDIRVEQELRIDDMAALEKYGLYKDPGTATIFSIIIPGGGQIYAGEMDKGLTQLGLASLVFSVGYAITASTEKYEVQEDFTMKDKTNYTPMTIGTVLYAAIWGYSIASAAESALRMNQRRLDYQLSMTGNTPHLELSYRF